MIDDIPNPHDALFKRVFGNVESSRVFFREFLPAPLAAELDLERLQLEHGSFVDERLRERHSDLLFSTVLKSGRDACIYLLFEHQSTPDRDIPFRLWRYLGNIWDRHRRRNPDEPGGPFIVPLVLYHGEKPWNVSRFFSEVLVPGSELGLRSPELEYLLLDLSRVSDEQIRRAIREAIEVGIGLSLLKHGRDGDFTRFLGALIPFLTELAHRSTGLDCIETFLRYIYNIRCVEEWGEVVELFRRAEPKIEEGTLTTIAEYLMQKGEERGEERGRVNTAREILIELLQEQFGSLPAAIEGRLFEVQNDGVLKALRRQLKNCDSVEDFRRLLEQSAN